MNSLILRALRSVSAPRVLLAASCALALAGCETDGTGPSAAGARKAEVAATSHEADAPKAQAAKPAEPVVDSEPMTRSRAARECWMRTEKANAREDLDKRADIVNKCIDEKLKAAGASAPKT